MNKIVYFSVFLFLSVICLNVCEAKQESSSVVFKNEKPSDSPRWIVNLKENERKFVDTWEFFGDYNDKITKKELHISYTIELDDGKIIDLGFVWKSSLRQIEQLEKLFHSFHLSIGDVLDFSVPNYRVWDYAYGNSLRFEVTREGVSLGKFSGFYRIPGSNQSW